ncbi:MAG: hypothetical protein Q7T68_15235 [Sphingopyxis sp.]|nr:hypothetical protein [Sphingopyxis sp.]
MRLMIAVIVSAAALGVGVSATKPTPAPFEGAWMSCETYQGGRICGYKLLVQRGSRVCGIQRDFATNAYYQQRFVGTARANSVKIDKICGDPGSETDTYCAGQTSQRDVKSGWGTSINSLYDCGGRLHGAKSDYGFRCDAANRAAGLPKVRSLKGEGPEPEDAAWLKSCAAGAE